MDIRRPDGGTESREYSLLEQDHEHVARRLQETLGPVRHAFTQWTAAHLRKPHVPPQVTSAYVGDFPDEALLKSALKARRVERGGRLRLYRPKDDGVFLGARSIDGLLVVSDIQISLDEQVREVSRVPEPQSCHGAVGAVDGLASMSRYHEDLVLVGRLGVALPDTVSARRLSGSRDHRRRPRAGRLEQE